MQPTQRHSARVRVNILHRGSRSAQPRAVAIVPSSSRSELTLALLQLISIRSPSPSLVFSLSLFLSFSLPPRSRRRARRSALRSCGARFFSLLSLFVFVETISLRFSLLFLLRVDTRCIPGATPCIVMQLRHSPQKKIVSLSSR